MNKSAKRILVSGVLAAALFLSAQNMSLANEKNPKAAISTEDNALAEKVSVNYIGTKDNSFMFHVNFNDAVSDVVFLTITDETGESLYSAKIDSKNYAKTFAVPEDLNIQKISFIIKTSVTTKDGTLTTDRVKSFSMSNLSEK